MAVVRASYFAVRVNAMTKTLLFCVSLWLGGQPFSVASNNVGAYLQGLYAYTLGYGHVEFYEAYVVVDREAFSRSDVVSVLRPLCSEFPKLDTYTVRIFSDAKWAQPQDFEWALGPRSSRIKNLLADKYLAEIRPDGKATVYPYGKTAKREDFRPRWCK